MVSLPAVSIILPTYNRADVLSRAVNSVLAQTFGDWELLLIDDGSTDGTVEKFSNIDPRIEVITQPNAGVYTARNNGLARARGRWITFLDSDDGWTPHYLELTTAFLASHPDRHFVTTEFWEDFGTSERTKYDIAWIRERYPRLAHAVGSKLYDLPAGETDDYMRVYSVRHSAEPWAGDILRRNDLGPVNVYQGNIFPHMRFGYLNWLPITMLTRHAVDTIGPFTTHTRSAADYHFLCRLTRAFPASLIAVPCATKFEYAAPGKGLKQDHLASGRGAYRFEVNKLGFFDEIYVKSMPDDEEIALLRRHFSLDAARAALKLGMRKEAREHLRAAAALRQRLWVAYPWLLLADLVPIDDWAGAIFRGGIRVLDIIRMAAAGQVTLAKILNRLVRPSSAAS